MGKPRFIAASFSGKLKKEERRVRTEGTEGTEKDENIEDIPDGVEENMPT